MHEIFLNSIRFVLIIAGYLVMHYEQTAVFALPTCSPFHRYFYLHGLTLASPGGSLCHTMAIKYVLKTKGNSVTIIVETGPDRSGTRNWLHLVISIHTEECLIYVLVIISRILPLKAGACSAPVYDFCVAARTYHTLAALFAIQWL